MALQAQYVHVTELQHVRVRRPVGHMAGRAALGFYRRMFEDERAVLVDMTLKADRVLTGGDTYLLGARGAVRVMAIRALNETFVYTMMKRHGKLRLLLQVAGIAKLRLRFNQQEVLILCMVRRVAGDAADVVLPVE
jgi:hypothetical protein